MRTIALTLEQLEANWDSNVIGNLDAPPDATADTAEVAPSVFEVSDELTAPSSKAALTTESESSIGSDGTRREESAEEPIPSDWDPFSVLQDGAPSAQEKAAPPTEKNPSDPFADLFAEDRTIIKAPITTYRDLSGVTLGRFVLHERIAVGQSGDIYKAWDPVRGELVAVKVIHSQNPQSRQRLLRGGRLWMKLSHPNIIRVLEVHPDYDGQAGVIVYDMVDGVNLEEVVARRNLSMEQIVSIVLQLCDGLSALHEVGVVHREVKPRNILVSGHRLYTTLLDSGIARHANPQVDAFTKTGIFVGDLAYAAPEQTSGHVDQRTDIYAVTAVLYEVLTKSKIPFPTPTGWQIDEDLLAKVPGRLRDIIKRGLQKDPRERFSSVQELHDQLLGFAPIYKTATLRRSVVAFHGIRTRAAWQRAFSEISAGAGLTAHLDRWNFGYFSIFRFLSPWSRLARVRWFRETYQQEFRASLNADPHQLPSIVAHSFGTYILGNALLRYPYLRFHKVLLCGSILPKSFPWFRIIDRGQVQVVRNEYGSNDLWTRVVAWFVPSTGQSGLVGFNGKHPRLQQERFEFDHSEYFEHGHMQERWLPHLTAQVDQRPLENTDVPIPAGDHRPWALYLILFAICALILTGPSVLFLLTR